MLGNTSYCLDCYEKHETNYYNKNPIEEEELKWKYIKEYLNYEWGHSSIKIKDIYNIAYEYDENEGGISVDMKGKECRDEDLNDYIQRKITPELFEEEEKVCCVGCGIEVCGYDEEPPHKDSRDEAVCYECCEDDETTIQYRKEIEEGCPEGYETIWNEYGFKYVEKTE